MFAGTFSKQSYFDIEKEINEKGTDNFHTRINFHRLQAQPLPATPKLVVTLTIDQLRTDYMEAFSSLYGEKGFKRLMREGKVFYQTEFPFSGTDRASAIAAIYSGTTPSMNGIISQQWMNANTLRPMNCVDDPALWETSPTRAPLLPNY